MSRSVAARNVAAVLEKTWGRSSLPAANVAGIRRQSSFGSSTSRTVDNRRAKAKSFLDATRGPAGSARSAATFAVPRTASPPWAEASARKYQVDRLHSIIESTRGAAGLAFKTVSDVTSASAAGIAEAIAGATQSSDTNRPSWVDRSVKPAAKAWIDRDGNIRASVLKHLAFSAGGFMQRRPESSQDERRAAVKHFFNAPRGSSKSIIPPQFDGTGGSEKTTTAPDECEMARS